MNKRKLYVFLMAVLLAVGIIGSQLGSARASCLRNCPWDASIANFLPDRE